MQTYEKECLQMHSSMLLYYDPNINLIISLRNNKSLLEDRLYELRALGF